MHALTTKTTTTTKLRSRVFQRFPKSFNITSDEFLQPALIKFPLQATEVVNEEDPVKVIHLVLDTDSEDAVSIKGVFSSKFILIADGDLFSSLNRVVVVGDAQAALL